MVCVPTDSPLVENDAPEPIEPSRSDDQARLALMSPSSPSTAVPAKPTEVPWSNDLEDWLGGENDAHSRNDDYPF